MGTKNFSFGQFSIDVPSDWEVSSIKMSDNETTIGISDLVKVRLEIHWQEAKWKQLKKEAKLKGKPLNKDLLTPEEVAESYHESVRKKDKNADFDEQLKRETVEGHPEMALPWPRPSTSQGLLSL